MGTSSFLEEGKNLPLLQDLKRRTRDGYVQYRRQAISKKVVSPMT